MLELLGASIWMFFMSLVGMRGQSGAAELPTDPLSRSRHIASNCLTLLKTELADKAILDLENSRVRYRGADGEERSLWAEGGAVHVQVGTASPSTPIRLGEEGRISFERTASGQLLASIVAVTPPASHRVSVILKVHQPSS